MMTVAVVKLVRLQDSWQAKADEFQRLATGMDSEQGVRYAEKAAGYRRAIRDLQDVIDSFAMSEPPFEPDESDIAAMSDRDFR